MDDATPVATQFNEAVFATPTARSIAVRLDGSNGVRAHFGRRIGEIIESLGYADQNQVATAVNEAASQGLLTGQVMLDRGFITGEQLTRAIAARTQLPYLDPQTHHPDRRVMATIDATTAFRYSAVPVQLIDNRILTVAICEPSNVLVTDDISLMTGLEVRAVLTTEGHLGDLLALMTKAEAGGRAERAVLAHDEQATAHLLDSIFAEAMRVSASDIHLDPREDGAVRVRFRVDGLAQETMIVTPALAGRLLARLKILSGMDISMRHVPQDGRAVYAHGSGEVSLRVATLPTIYGESAAVRVLDRNNVPPIERLGLDGPALVAVERALRKTHGAILATGPTGSGKTTTLYAALQRLNTPERTVITIEDPVEYPMAGVKQVQVDQKRGLGFAAGLRTVLRSDPDVVMIGEIRDRETAKTGIEAALVGRLVLSTLHTNDAATAVTRLVEMGVERYLVSSSVECVIASRLARKLCEECRVPHLVGERELLDAGFIDRDPFDAYAAAGCASCGGTGYRGRTGLFEVMPFNPEIRGLVLESAPSSVIADAAARAGMKPLRDSALDRVRDGVTSLAESVRVSSVE